MAITEALGMKKRWGLSIKTEIENMMKMVRRHDIIIDFVNDTLIREGGRKKRYQMSKYTILKNGSSYVHHDWEKNFKPRKKVAVP